MPGTFAERLALAQRHDLALEVAVDEDFDRSRWQAQEGRVVSLQAVRMHALHPLHPDEDVLAEAHAYLLEVLEHACALAVPRIVVACGFGERVASDPEERCRRFFSSLARPARSAGVRLLLEPLSPLRAAAMTGQAELDRLLRALAAPEVFGSVVDVGHLQDAGEVVDAWLARWPHRVDELQLRGPGSTPPAPDQPVGAWLANLAPAPELLVGEHHGVLSEDALGERLTAFRAWARE